MEDGANIPPPKLERPNPSFQKFKSVRIFFYSELAGVTWRKRKALLNEKMPVSHSSIVDGAGHWLSAQ
jgi:hypothetical protein